MLHHSANCDEGSFGGCSKRQAKAVSVKATNGVAVEVGATGVIVAGRDVAVGAAVAGTQAVSKARINISKIFPENMNCSFTFEPVLTGTPSPLPAEHTKRSHLRGMILPSDNCTKSDA